MLNISRQIYSGWNTASANELPEAEIIPFGKSSNEKKRLETFTKRYPVLNEYENIPLPGFTLYKSNRKNYGSADPTWLIIDPRGFMVRITNDNLEDILHVTGITEGLIQQKCVWAREDSQTKMILVPISSPLYVEAMDNTELLEDRVDLKEVQIGDKVLLQNKLTGTFMGVFSLYSPIDPYSTIHKPGVFLRRQIVMIEPGKYHYQTDVKILKVVEKTSTPMTREESTAFMNAEIKNNIAQFSNSTHFSPSGYYTTRGMIKHVSTHAVPKVTLSFEEITKEEADSVFDAAATLGDSGMLVLENSVGKKHLIDFPYNYSTIRASSGGTFSVYEILPLDANATEIYQKEDPTASRNWYTSRPTKSVHSLDSFTKFYKIVKHVKTESYV